MAGQGDEVLTWQAGSGLRPGSAGSARLLVADSWLLDAGRVRGLDLHRQRFAGSCGDAAGVRPAELDEFWRAVVERLPRSGTWFPRVELAAAPRGPPRLWLRIRPAPARTEEVRVWVSPGPDGRTMPRRKGPDLDRLAELRHAGAQAGAQEVLLTTRSGLVLEAANSSLMWWEGPALCLTDPALRVLPGVTAALVRRHAARCGIPVRNRRSRLADLDGREAWLTNALHGIRPVTAWVGSTVSAGAATRAAQWRQWWTDWAEPLPDPVAARSGDRVTR